MNRSAISAAVLLALGGCATQPVVAVGVILDERLRELYAQPSPFESVPRDKWIAESANAYVIRDINPRAPVHVLVIPKQRIPTLLQASPALLGEMLDLARRVAIQEGVAQDGFKTLISTHPGGGQEVYHLHIHVIGGGAAPPR